MIKSLARTFEEDWAASAADLDEKDSTQKEQNRTVKKVAQEISKKIALNPVAKKVVKTISDHADVDLDHKELRDTVKEILRDVVDQTAQDAVSQLTETAGKAN